MTRTLRSSSEDLHPTGDCTDRDANLDPARPPATSSAVAPAEALVALARLLGRQAARAFLRGEDEGGAGSPLAGDPTDVPPQTPFPTAGTGSEADASSDPA